ncbi:MAG: hypothetical protein K2N94_13335, partial [Lachnospiraceae bacterium]|nr:hypothetical protein [Lachnospiraceae bacterium]
CIIIIFKMIYFDISAKNYCPHGKNIGNSLDMENTVRYNTRSDKESRGKGFGAAYSLVNP